MVESRYAWLLYGDEGAGKSFMLASSLVNPITGEVRRRGCILDFEGRLGHLGVPDEMVVSMRPDYSRPERTVDELRGWLRKYQRQLAAGEPPYDVIGLDSLTELQFLLRLGMAKEAATENPKEDDEVLSQRSWGILGDRLAYDIGYMRPRYTGAHLIVTAYAADDRDNPRVSEAIKHASLQGQLADKIGHFFDFVIYVENKTIGRGENVKVAHRYHFRSGGDFKAKNILEHQKVFPPYVDGTAEEPATFDTFLAYIKGEKKA